MGDIYIVFDKMPGPEGCTFIEVEDEDGKGLRVGEWMNRDDGYVALHIGPEDLGFKPVQEIP